MRECRQRLDHRALAHVGGAKIRLQPPDREKDLRRHAKPLLDAREQRRVALQPVLRALDAAGGDARPRIVLEALAERAALAVVERDHLLIERDAGERLIDDGEADARGLRLARHLAQEAVEIPAALRAECGCCEDRENECGERALEHR